MWTALIVLLIVAAIVVPIYFVNRHKAKSEPPKSHEEEMAEIYCPDLLDEVMRLKNENKRLKEALRRKQDHVTSAC